MDTASSPALMAGSPTITASPEHMTPDLLFEYGLVVLTLVFVAAFLAAVIAAVIAAIFDE